MSEIMVTLASMATGQSESIPVPPETTVRQLMELTRALINPVGEFRLFKDGRSLDPSKTLQSEGVVHGDLLAIRNIQRVQATPQPPAPSVGQLDFSSLLGSAAPPAAAQSSSTTASAAPPPPFYYQGMTLEDAMMHNPHPLALMQVLMGQEVLFKQLNYHQPQLAAKLRGKSLEEAAKVWREELVRGGIRRAVEATEQNKMEREMRLRIERNPADAEAKAYFDKKKHQTEIENQYREMMQEYPEAMGRILMLYIEAKVNGTSIQAFVDSGAQSTIMSLKCAKACGIDHLIDTRFEGMAVGVGTGKILGRIHIVSLQIGNSYFPCTVTIMEKMGQEEMDFLLGLDMLKRHTCQIDLEHGVLRFKLGAGQYMATPFLHEKDLDETRGGTRGFDADRANRELEEFRGKKEEN